MISIIDCDQTKEYAQKEPSNRHVDIMAVEFVQGKPYICPTLTLSKGKEVAKPEKKAYLFDISKANQIFDYLVKDK